MITPSKAEARRLQNVENINQKKPWSKKLTEDIINCCNRTLVDHNSTEKRVEVMISDCQRQNVRELRRAMKVMEDLGYEWETGHTKSRTYPYNLRHTIILTWH